MSTKQDSQTTGMSPRCRLGMWLAVLAAVGIVYALPLIASWVQLGRPLYALDEEDLLYQVRIMDAYRGGTLGNPYLVEHQDAPRLMPEFGERTLAFLARASGADVLQVTALSRVIAPVLLAFLIALLARSLEIPDSLALLAGMMATLFSKPRVLLPGLTGGPFVLRYMRPASPSLYLAVMLAALILIAVVERQERGSRLVRWIVMLLGGSLTGLCSYSLVYFWSFPIFLLLWLILRRPPARRDLLLVLGLSVVLAIPYLRHTALSVADPAVNEMLHRFAVMTPGREPDMGVEHLFLIAAAVAFLAFLLSRRLQAAAFLWPLLAFGAFCFRQNLVTNLHLQAHHWLISLIPLWSILAAGLLTLWPRLAQPVVVSALMLSLTMFGLVVQGIAYHDYRQLVFGAPTLLDLDRSLPETLAWLNRNTMPGSVVFTANQGLQQSLPLFTRNKLYSSPFACQYVVSDAECLRRQHGLRPLAYRADYQLEIQSGCTGTRVYENGRERTAVCSFSSKAGTPP